MPWAQRRGSRAIYQTPAHKKARAAMVAAFQPGDPCCLCGHGMYGPTRNLHADHAPGTDRYRGLAHGLTPCQDCGKRCNVSDGAKRGRARQDARTTQLRW